MTEMVKCSQCETVRSKDQLDKTKGLCVACDYKNWQIKNETKKCTMCGGDLPTETNIAYMICLKCYNNHERGVVQKYKENNK